MLYSARAGNAAIRIADLGVFPRFLHVFSLPADGAAGYATGR